MAAAHTLYLVRHAIAAERGDKWPDDADRPLTHEGAARMRQVVEGLEALDVEIDLVVTSPLRRAVETAEIVAAGFDPAPDIITAPALAPGGAPARVADVLGAHGKSRRIAIVGHEPDLGELAAWCIGARCPLPFKKGGIAQLEAPEWPPARHTCTLVWMATPRMLRALAK